MTGSRHPAFRHAPRATPATLGELIATAYDALGPAASGERVAWLLTTTIAGRRSRGRAVRFG